MYFYNWYDILILNLWPFTSYTVILKKEHFPMYSLNSFKKVPRGILWLWKPFNYSSLTIDIFIKLIIICKIIRILIQVLSYIVSRILTSWYIIINIVMFFKRDKTTISKHYKINLNLNCPCFKIYIFYKEVDSFLNTSFKSLIWNCIDIIH